MAELMASGCRFVLVDQHAVDLAAPNSHGGTCRLSRQAQEGRLSVIVLLVWHSFRPLAQRIGLMSRECWVEAVMTILLAERNFWRGWKDERI
jgi:hypothetical protein